MELHETVMGRKLIEGTLPDIAIQLERIAKVMENNVKEDEASKKLIEFLEYEEALTKDKETAARIRTLLKLLKIWN
jgi:hypothetical protein